MLKVSVEHASLQLKSLLERVSLGEVVILTEKNQEVARLIPPQNRDQWLARTKVFRESLQVQGEALSATIIKAREEDRF